jgi:hypothetical protein
METYGRIEVATQLYKAIENASDTTAVAVADLNDAVRDAFEDVGELT